MTPRPKAAHNTLPEAFAQELRTMRLAQDLRLPGTLRAAHTAGWTYQSLADALGCTRQNVDRISRLPLANPGLDLPVIPSPPSKTATTLPSRRPKPQLTTEQVEEIRRLQVDARKVVGQMPADSPIRAISRRYSALLAHYRDTGVPITELAQAAGVKPPAIVGRLTRHGYSRTSATSRDLYIGRPAQGGGGANPDAIQG